MSAIAPVMTRALVLLVVLVLGAACRTTGMRERFGGLWSDELVHAARYLPAGFEACRITTATLLDYMEDGVIVAVPRRTSLEETLVWASRVQDLSHIPFFDDL